MASLPTVIPAAFTAVGTGRLPVQPSYITWGDPVTDPPASLGLQTFDAILSEEHDRSAIVTDHPVEQGTNIVDNVRPLPDRLQLEVFVSNAPVNSPDAQRGPLTLEIPHPGQGSFLAGGLTASIGGALGLDGRPGPTYSVNVDLFPGDTDYVAETYATLTQLQSTATLLSVLTPRATYSNMILESVKMHRNPGVGTGANFTLEFREVLIVTSSVVAAPLPSIPRGQSTAATGNQQTKTPTGPMKSVAAAGYDGAGKLLAGLLP
jgi:hypothetical protein